MNSNTKDAVQVWSAVGMLIAGVAVSVAGFIVPPVGHISDSVLMFTAQALIYAGSALGIDLYIRKKLEQMQDNNHQ